MTEGNGLRLVSAGRKSRKGDENSQFDRQEARNADRAQKDGHVIVHTTRDVISSQTMPWERKNLRQWMTEPTMLEMYDAILVETDRLARCDDKGWHYIEGWCYDNDKKILTTEGVQFPPRDDSDRYQWVGLKRRARTYWEDVRDKHAQTRELIKANGAAIGRAPFGYTIVGDKLHKTFVIDPVTGALAKEAFKRISEGHTATSVAIWLSEVTGTMWRVKRVTDMISRRTYLGERDGHVFEALVSEEMFNSANSALAARSFKHVDKGGRRAEHGYSGLIFCECGAQFYRHQSTRDGKPVGDEKYRCGRGRRGNPGETRCEFGAPKFSEVNTLVDEKMSKQWVKDVVMVTTGGDHGKQMELQALQDAMKSAFAKMDMSEVTRLAALISELQGRESQPVVVEYKYSDETLGQMWSAGDLADRRALLGRMVFNVIVKMTDGQWTVALKNAGKGTPIED